jgi:hypothetical protein
VTPGHPWDGFLLGRSATRIPSAYSHGFELSFGFSVLDGFDNPHTAEVLVLVDEQLCVKIRRPLRRVSPLAGRDELRVESADSQGRDREAGAAMNAGLREQDKKAHTQ